MQFVLQIGESDHNSDPGQDNGPYVDTHHMMEGLQNVGFEYNRFYLFLSKVCVCGGGILKHGLHYAEWLF